LPSIGNFAIYKNGQIIAICKLQFIKTAKLMQFSKFQLKKPSQIKAILQIIKIPLYRDFLQFIKTAKIIAILQIANYKNGQIIAILQIAIYENRQIPSIGNFCKFTKTAKLLQLCKLQFIKTDKLLKFCKLLKSPL
jgi:hypothetical protein